MKKNSIKISILSLLFIVSLGIGAMAKNNSDTFTQMSGGNWGATDYSAEREKEDSSPVYFKPTYFSGAQDGDYFVMSVVPGSNTSSFKTWYAPRLEAGNEGCEQYISTLAYEENGGCNVKLRAESVFRFSYSYYMGGLWSPDSSM